MKTILGLSFGYHDAAITVLDSDSGSILFASQAERYSKVKNDKWLNKELIAAALSYGDPEVMVMHENFLKTKWRHAKAGNWKGVFEPTPLTWLGFYPELDDIPIKYMSHHQSHIASSWLTWDEPLIGGPPKALGIVIDAIGEIDTASKWALGEEWGSMRKLSSVKYPHSLGLFYTAMTHAVGLKPNEDEYILMGMAAYGTSKAKEIVERIKFEVFDPKTTKPIQQLINLHKGFPADHWIREYNDFDIASAAQTIFENRMDWFIRQGRAEFASDNLVYSGGCALNCSANTNLFNQFDTVTIMPNPGDAGSSLGAAAAYYYEKTNSFITEEEDFTPFLGHNIPGDYPVEKAMDSLRNGEVFGIANGRAEFGPRALGNRSLLADPRSDDIKDKVNAIKKRQEFRPFAPVILEEYLEDYFDIPKNLVRSQYMQFTLRCRFPHKFPGIVHKDGTSRVQTVSVFDNPGLHTLLSRYHEETGCPMLLNTSLNIKGQPIVNDEEDAKAFEEAYNVKVHLRA
jgi:carbamoyltransferase